MSRSVPLEPPSKEILHISSHYLEILVKYIYSIQFNSVMARFAEVTRLSDTGPPFSQRSSNPKKDRRVIDPTFRSEVQGNFQRKRSWMPGTGLKRLEATSLQMCAYVRNRGNQPDVRYWYQGDLGDPASPQVGRLQGPGYKDVSVAWPLRSFYIVRFGEPRASSR